jgi:hypothetical protein
LHPATDRENQKPHPIDKIHCAPKPCMPEFDIKAIHLQEHLMTDRVFLSGPHREYGSSIAILLQVRYVQTLIRESGV